jgi:hypothetical protein
VAAALTELLLHKRELAPQLLEFERRREARVVVRRVKQSVDPGSELF